MILAWKAGPRLERAEDKLDQLTRQVRLLEMEWESTYNKLRALLARLNKRDERELTPAPVNHNPNNTNHGGIPETAVPRQWELASLAKRSGHE
jgi:uncharacterized coiled-coil protein SlyX